jgi:hypothetical protein
MRDAMAITSVFPVDEREYTFSGCGMLLERGVEERGSYR